MATALRREERRADGARAEAVGAGAMAMAGAGGRQVGQGRERPARSLVGGGEPVAAAGGFARGEPVAGAGSFARERAQGHGRGAGEPTSGRGKANGRATAAQLGLATGERTRQDGRGGGRACDRGVGACGRGGEGEACGLEPRPESGGDFRGKRSRRGCGGAAAYGDELVAHMRGVFSFFSFFYSFFFLLFRPRILDAALDTNSASTISRGTFGKSTVGPAGRAHCGCSRAGRAAGAAQQLQTHRHLGQHGHPRAAFCPARLLGRQVARRTCTH